MKLSGRYTAGDLDGYRASSALMRNRLEQFSGTLVVAHHGDCDGIVGGGFVGRFLRDRGVAVRYASAAEFRQNDLEYFTSQALGADAGVFVEAQGMPEGYRVFDERFVNIDHHPHPPNTPVRRMLNPRSHGVEPNPAIALVIFELLGDALPSNAGWIAALGSIVDYCRAPAEPVIAEYTRELRSLDELRETFTASQYVRPYTTDLAAFIAEMPSPEELLAREPFRGRRELFGTLMEEALASAHVRGRMVIAETEPFVDERLGEFRLSSPLANRLQDRYNSMCVIVVERGPVTARFSVRFRDGGTHLGRLLETIARKLNAGDGTGHEKAGSARVPVGLKDEFLAVLEEQIGQSTT